MEQIALITRLDRNKLMKDISLITLSDYSLLNISNPNGSAIEIRLTPAQLDYIAEKIAFNKKYYGSTIKAGN